MSNTVEYPTRLGVEVRSKIGPQHLARTPYLYVRQSSPYQVEHNLESKRLQYDRVRWAAEAGWSGERVVIVDDDQGTTATLPNSRSGFAEMMAAVANREVGVVVALEGARLARNGPDWANLLFLCRWTDTLIADRHGVYDLSSPSDRMVLGIRGQVSELELDTSIQRMVEARWSKAKNGKMVTIPPAGYDVDELERLVLTRDEAVAEAFRMLFAKFDELSSARQVWRWWLDEGLKFPVRRLRPRVLPVVWVRPAYRNILSTLKHPIYAGAFVFGRSRTMRELDPEHPGRLLVRQRSVPREEWPVLLLDHHEAYIPWERYLANQQRMRDNCMMLRTRDDTVSGPPREGKALLQGLIRCGHCGRRMLVNFGGRAGGPKGRTPQYRCRGAEGKVEGGQECHTVGSQRIDALVVEAFLVAVAPASLEVAARAEELARQESEERERIWRLQIEKAEYEAKRAERQYMAVEPENRLVVRTLEREWNERLAELEAVRARAAEARRRQAPLDEATWERIGELAGDLESVWRASTTTDRDRKRLLRCLVEEVQLTTEDERHLVRVVWKGGAVTDLEVARWRRGRTSHRTPEDTVELVRRLAVEFDDLQIARILNKQGRRTGLGNTFTQVRVQSLRGKHRIAKCKRKPEQDPRTGPFTADEAAEQLGVTSTTVHRWLDRGILVGRQATPGAPWRIHLTEDLRRRLKSGEAPAGWVGVAEAARRLGTSTSHVSYMVKRGKLPAMRTTVGKRRCWRIDLSSATCGRQRDLLDETEEDTSSEA